MKTTLPGMMIAGTASGVGKTTVALAIIAALRVRGLAVQAFKGGPDFLDTGHHSRVSGRVARNLDTWMLSADANRAVFSEAGAGADALVVEGMMGLFDGKDAVQENGSSAEIAKLLGLPVVLVVDAGKSARSVAAVVLGFELFDPALPLAGVILNRVAGDRHYALLSAAIAARCKTPVLGWLGREPAIAIPERHLGLQTVEETATEQLRDALAGAASHLDLEALLCLHFGLDCTVAPMTTSWVGSGAMPPNESNPPFLRKPERMGHPRVVRTERVVGQDCEQVLDCAVGPTGMPAQPVVRIGVAQDSAFSFYYEDNLDLLRNAGAEVVYFSPMYDSSLPPGLDALYLGGGYPEFYADQLSANRDMLHEMRAFAEQQRPIYAECGGMLYLSQSLTTKDTREHSMAGVLPCRFEMTSRLVNFGYVTVLLTENCLLGEAGTEIRGHSFHYSRLLGAPPPDTCYEVTYSLSKRVEPEGFRLGSVLASYIHLHFRAAPGIAERFVAATLAGRHVNQEVLA